MKLQDMNQFCSNYKLITRESKNINTVVQFIVGIKFKTKLIMIISLYPNCINNNDYITHSYQKMMKFYRVSAFIIVLCKEESLFMY